MSGGSMDHLHLKVKNAQFRLNTWERRAFKKHLDLVAQALKDIEWNDSGDGSDNEVESIMKCLTIKEMKK